MNFVSERSAPGWFPESLTRVYKNYFCVGKTVKQPPQHPGAGGTCPKHLLTHQITEAGEERRTD